MTYTEKIVNRLINRGNSTKVRVIAYIGPKSFDEAIKNGLIACDIHGQVTLT